MLDDGGPAPIIARAEPEIMQIYLYFLAGADLGGGGNI